MNATSACLCLGICAALFRHRLKGNPENWWLAVGRVNVFRSSVFNNALSPSSPKDRQSSTEWCCSVMKRCLLLVVFAKIVPEFDWSALDLNNVFLVCTSAVRLSALWGVFYRRTLTSTLLACICTAFFISYSKVQSCGSTMESWHWGRALQWFCDWEKKICRDFRTWGFRGGCDDAV